MNAPPWQRPAIKSEARQRMVQAERLRDYESAALAAIAMADFASTDAAEAKHGRQALVYASLHQAQTTLFIAEQLSR